jgi:hypothetical protein
MRLIINKELDYINENVNIKIIEITSTDFLNNNLDYFVYKHQIPLIKFIDTEEIFIINNFKSRLNSSLAETVIIIDETDLESISSSGSEGVQSVTGDGVDNTDPQNPVITMGNGFVTLDTEQTITAPKSIEVEGRGNIDFLNGSDIILTSTDGNTYINRLSTGDGDSSIYSGNIETGNSATIGCQAMYNGNEIATISPISGTFLAPTSITVTNGIITAIS